MKLIVFLLVAFGILLYLFPPYSHKGYIPVKEYPKPEVPDSDKVFTLVNEYRADHGLEKLRWNESMCPFTKLRLKELHTDYSHAGYVKSVNNYSPYSSASAGSENLASAAYTNKDLVNSWINSPPHKGAIMDKRFTDTCVAVDSLYAVQHFIGF